jgi:hypothetical protein
MKKMLYLTLLAAGTVHAADWRPVGLAATAITYIDQNSVVETGRYRKAWAMYDSQESRKLENTYPVQYYKSFKSLYYFDCDERRFGVFQITYYPDGQGDGEQIKSFSNQFNPSQLTEVAPDTVGEALLEFVCKAPARNAKSTKQKTSDYLDMPRKR